MSATPDGVFAKRIGFKRMLSKSVRLIAGLGNPGDNYEKTRHNAGFMVVDKVAKTFSIRFDKKKFDVSFGRGTISDIDVILAKPQAYMNRSGLPLRQLTHYFKILSRDMLIIHDDIDLAMGRIKIKEKGGHGGHNGLKSWLMPLETGILFVFASASAVPNTST